VAGPMRGIPEAGATTATSIELVGVQKVYRSGKLEYPALRGVDLSISSGEMVAIVGPSGSGKSTIINIITGIDRPTAGTVTVGGARIDELSEEQLASWRGEKRWDRVSVLPAAADADGT
jgi:putative ABC transport system ATP-binding protein